LPKNNIPSVTWTWFKTHGDADLTLPPKGEYSPWNKLISISLRPCDILMVCRHGALFSSICAFLVVILVHEQQNHVK